MTTAEYLQTLARIKAARRFGKVISGCVERPSASAGAAAADFGLSGKAAVYREVPADEAVLLLAAVLHRDMAYDQQIMPAARALGLDVGPMAGFDAAALDAAFFPDSRVKTFLVLNLGYGDKSSLFPRLPRLAFDEYARIA